MWCCIGEPEDANDERGDDEDDDLRRLASWLNSGNTLGVNSAHKA